VLPLCAALWQQSTPHKQALGQAQARHARASPSSLTQCVFCLSPQVDERKFLSGKYWMPYHIGRETWHPYPTKTAWFWESGAKAAKKLT